MKPKFVCCVPLSGKKRKRKNRTRKRKKQKRIVTLFVVGGLSYYIGYEMGKDKHEGKPGGKKPPMIWRDK